MSRIVRWVRRTSGQRRPTDHPELPSDWAAIHIRREDIPNRHTEEDEKFGARRGEKAAESIDEILDAFPAEQIKSSDRRMSDD